MFYNSDLLHTEEETIIQFCESINKANYLRTYKVNVPLNGISIGTVKRVQSNKNMLFLISEMYSKGILVKGGFLDITFRLIAFHQAFFGLPHIPPFSELKIGKLGNYVLVIVNDNI